MPGMIPWTFVVGRAPWDGSRVMLLSRQSHPQVKRRPVPSSFSHWPIPSKATKLVTGSYHFL